jgi:hypothetical protein
MKNLNIIALILIVICSIACEDTDYIKYDTEQKDAILLSGVFSEENDSTHFAFDFRKNVDTTLFVHAELMGMVRDYDRKFKISENNSKYANDDVIEATSKYFEIPDFVTLSKNETRTKIPIKIFRHEDLKSKMAVITLNIEATDDLNVNGITEYTITFDDMIPKKPVWWTWGLAHFTREKGEKFLEYYWEMENENKQMYNLIKERWGRYLDKLPNYGNNNPLIVYRITFNKYVIMKMYEYSEAHPELDWKIRKPII